MYMLTITTETYSRTASDKGWKSQPDTTETETVPWYAHDTPGRQSGETRHHNITSPDTLKWFRRLGGSEYAERSYTPVGYIVTRLVSTNPNRTVRKIRRFRITDETCAPGITLDPASGEFSGTAARSRVYHV